MTIALFIVVAILLATIIFLMSQFKKKFKFMQTFLAESVLKVTCFTPAGRFTRPGMRKIALRSQTGKPFTALVGFTLKIPIIGLEGFDYYGVVNSDDTGTAVISTFVGNGDVEFVFVINRNNRDGDIVASLELEDHFLKPQETYPPHWWQRLGF